MKIYHRNHTTSGSFVRVWKEGWASDAFEIMHREDFDHMQTLTREVIEFIDRNGDDD